MSTGDHLRAATHHARTYAEWKRAEAGANLGMRANDEHARAVGANMMGNPSGAHGHEVRAHLAAAAADAIAPSAPPLPPHVMPPPPLVSHHHHDVEVLPARVVVDEPPSPLSGDAIVVHESRSPVVHAAPPVHAVPPPVVGGAFVPPPPRMRMRDALRDVVNSKMRQGEAFMARKANQQHTMAVHSGAMGLPDKAHQHETKAHLAGAVASALHRPHHAPRSAHPVVVPPSPVVVETHVVQSPIYTSP